MLNRLIPTDLFIRGKMSEVLDTLSDPSHIILMLTHANRGIKFGKPSYLLLTYIASLVKTKTKTLLLRKNL